jgi:hypothetical protein
VDHGRPAVRGSRIARRLGSVLLIFIAAALAACVFAAVHHAEMIAHRVGEPTTAVPRPVPRHVAMSWAQRLKRVFDIDIETCKHCGGAVKIIACIEDATVIERIVTHRERGASGPGALQRASAPPGSWEKLFE